MSQNINDIIETIKNSSDNNPKDINEITTNILNHFSYVSGIDLDEYIYKDSENIEETVGGETDGEV